MRAEAEVPGPRRPSAEATEAPVTEAAVVETPIAKAPVAEAPAVESAVMEETLAEAPTTTPSLPAPMETVGGGDGPSWACKVLLLLRLAIRWSVLFVVLSVLNFWGML